VWATFAALARMYLQAWAHLFAAVWFSPLAGMRKFADDKWWSIVEGVVLGRVPSSDETRQTVACHASSSNSDGAHT